VGKDEVVQILRTLSYFRPREFDREELRRKEAQKFTKQELQGGVISEKHKELIEKSKHKTEMLPTQIFKFIFKNASTGVLKDLFTQI